MSNDTITITGIDSEDYTITLDDSMMSSISDDVLLTGADPISGTGVYTISTGAVGSNGVSWSSNTGSITFTDPYDELKERLDKLEAIIAEEKEIRDNCPAVRNAYDEYRFLLVLAKKNSGDLLTGS